MSNPFTLAITGPSGAGKTTIGQQLAKQIEHCVNIDTDFVKHFVVNGFIYDETAAGVNQWELLGNNLGLLAHNFKQAGYNVIVNGFIDIPAWNKLLNHISFDYKVLLLPHVDTTVQRDTLRIEDYIMGEARVKKGHKHFSSHNFFNNFVKIDSTKLSVEQTVDKIMEILKQS